MILSQQHIIKPNHKYYQECENLTFLSKNLYNFALYQIRQNYFENGSYLTYIDLANEMTKTKQVDYYALPTKVSKMTLRKLDKNFKSFFNANKKHKKEPKQFKAKPKIPKYLPKNGNFVTEYHIDAISKKKFKQGIICPSKTSIELTFKDITWGNLQGVRIVPCNNHFKIEVLYKVTKKELLSDNGKYCGLDLGINNLATLTFNEGSRPIIVNGKPIKSINQYYNKYKAKLQSILELTNNQKVSNRINKLTFKRNNKINDYLHKSSRYIVNQLVSKSITTIVIGKNKNWKQDINIGKVNNQKFVNIPFDKLISMLKYKCELVGINVVLTEESYTSKCSFLDKEAVGKHQVFLGKRIKRGLFRCDAGILINADVNGSFNIMRKVFPDIIDGIEGLSVIPMKKISFS